MVPGVQSPDKEKTDIADHLELAEAGDAEKVAANQRGLHNVSFAISPISGTSFSMLIFMGVVGGPLRSDSRVQYPTMVKNIYPPLLCHLHRLLLLMRKRVRRHPLRRTTVHAAFPIDFQIGNNRFQGIDHRVALHCVSLIPSNAPIVLTMCRGQIVGSPTAAIISDRFGRRIAMFCGAVLIIVGMIITATANTIAQFTVGRFILGFGVTQMTVSAPAYTMEIAPPHWRGRCTGACIASSPSTHADQTQAYTIAGGMEVRSQPLLSPSVPTSSTTTTRGESQSSFRRSHAQLSWARCLRFRNHLVSSWRMDEMRRRTTFWSSITAVAIRTRHWWLSRLPNSGRASCSTAQTNVGGTVSGFPQSLSHLTLSFQDRPLFSKHSSRWRMYQVILMSVAGQFSGNGLAYFNTVIYAKLGISTVTKQLAYNLLYACVSAIGAFIGAGFSDKMPRRKALVYGTLGEWLCRSWCISMLIHA